MVVNSANFLGFGDFRRYLLGGGELRIVSKGEMIIKTYRSWPHWMSFINFHLNVEEVANVGFHGFLGPFFFAHLGDDPRDPRFWPKAISARWWTANESVELTFVSPEALEWVENRMEIIHGDHEEKHVCRLSPSKSTQCVPRFSLMILRLPVQESINRNNGKWPTRWIKMAPGEATSCNQFGGCPFRYLYGSKNAKFAQPIDHLEPVLGWVLTLRWLWWRKKKTAPGFWRLPWNSSPWNSRQFLSCDTKRHDIAELA